MKLNLAAAAVALWANSANAQGLRPSLDPTPAKSPTSSVVRAVERPNLPLVHSNLTLTGNQRWLALASRESLPEAVELAKALSETIPNVIVLTSKSGWYAIVSGPHSGTSLEVVKSGINSPQSIPSDAYLTRGEGYIQYIWRPAPPAETQTAQTTSPAAKVDSSRLGNLVARAESVIEIRNLVAMNLLNNDALRPVNINFDYVLRVAKETCRMKAWDLPDTLYRLRKSLELPYVWDGNRTILPMQVQLLNKIDLWTNLFKCHNQLSPVEAYDQYVGGITDIGSLKEFQGTVPWMEMGAVLGDSTSQIMLAARYLYPASIGSLATSPGYGINMRGYEKLDRAGALAWALLAVLSGSDEARKFIDNRIFPLSNDQTDAEALALLTTHAKLRFEKLDDISKRKSELLAIANRIIPTIAYRSIENMTASNAQRYVRDEAQKVVAFFREASSYMTAYESGAAQNACIHDPLNKAINASGPDHIVKEFLTDAWRLCLVQFDRVVTAHGQKIRQRIIENGT